jgi:hypothetical protein
MTETAGIIRYADDDPEYATDAAAGIDIEAVGLEPDDPAIVPKDQGDSGSAAVPDGGA